MYLKKTASYLNITVHDWGQGIQPEQLPHLFEPFYTTKQTADRGLDIGLAIVKQSVENDFKGHIEVKSSSGFGTAFIVKLKLPVKTNARQYKLLPASSEVSGRVQAPLLVH